MTPCSSDLRGLDHLAGTLLFDITGPTALMLTTLYRKGPTSDNEMRVQINGLSRDCTLRTTV